MLTFLLIFVTAGIAVGLAGAVYQSIGVRRDESRYPAPGRMIDTGLGARLHLFALGEGGPTVILESGIASSSLNWRGLQKSLAEVTSVVSYDRGGLGWSGPCASPRTPTNIALELRDALVAAGLEPPFVLVGHSFGGLAMRRFAGLYPDEVGGVVLIEALDPAEWFPLSDKQRGLLAKGVRYARRGALLARLGVVRLAAFSILSGARLLPRVVSRAGGRPGRTALDRIAGQVGRMPREVWPMVAAHWSNPGSFGGISAHLEALPASAEEMCTVEPISGIPVTVISGGNRSLSDGYLQSISPDACHIVARESGHWVHLDEPDLVLDQVRSLVESVRKVTPARVH